MNSQQKLPDLLKLFLTKDVSLIPLLCPINVRENLF